jgi:hypothetical protein
MLAAQAPAGATSPDRHQPRAAVWRGGVTVVSAAFGLYTQPTWVIALGEAAARPGLVTWVWGASC